MKNFTIFGLVLCPVLFLYSCQKEETPIPGPKGEPVPGGADVDYHVNKNVLISLVNQVRESGCTCGTVVMPPVEPLSWSDQLAAIAFDHSVDMDLHDYFGHTDLKGLNPGDRLTASGYPWAVYGENIARDYPNEKSVMEGWLKSETHCMNIMDGRFMEFGAGREGQYWTQLFATRK